MIVSEKTKQEIELLHIRQSELVCADMSSLLQISTNCYQMKGVWNNRPVGIEVLLSGSDIAMMIKQEEGHSIENEDLVVLAYTNSQRTFKAGRIFDDLELKQAIVKQSYGLTTEFKKDHIDKDGEIYSYQDCENSGFFVAVDYTTEYFPCSHIGITGLKTPISGESKEVSLEYIIDADTLEVVSKFEKF